MIDLDKEYKYDKDGQYKAIESIQDAAALLNLDVYKCIFAKEYNETTKGLWELKSLKFFKTEQEGKMAAVQRPLLLSEMDPNELFFIPLWMAEDILGVEEADRLAAKKKEIDKERKKYELLLWADCRTGDNGKDACGNIVALYKDGEESAIEIVWDYHTKYKQVIMNAYSKHQIKDKDKWYELIKKQRAKNSAN